MNNSVIIERSVSIAGMHAFEPFSIVTSTATTTLPVGNAKIQRADEVQDAVANAVYAHIRAIRTLGRTQVNTTEIARALNLPLQKVQASIQQLKGKGVKIAL